MEKEQKRFRIVNKTNKTVTVKIGPESHTMTWDEYNQNFITVDKFWCVFNEEMEKMSQEMDEYADWISIAVMEMNAAQHQQDAGKELAAAYRVGSLTKKMQEKFNLTGMQVMQLVRKRLEVMNPFMVHPMFPVSNSQKKLRRKVEREADSEMNLTSEPVKENKPTLGDAFSSPILTRYMTSGHMTAIWRGMTRHFLSTGDFLCSILTGSTMSSSRNLSRMRSSTFRVRLKTSPKKTSTSMNIETYFDENHGRSWNFICAIVLLGLLAAVVAMCIVGVHFVNKDLEFLAHVSFFIAGMGSYFWFKGLFNFIKYVRKLE